MLQVIFMLVGVLLGFALCTIFMFYRYWVGSIYLKFVNSHLETSQLCFDSKKRKERTIKKLNYVLLTVDKFYYSDLDPIEISQQIQPL